MKFQVTQHSRDLDLVKTLIKFFSCGKYNGRNTVQAGDFIVTKFSDINEKIIPFFDMYPLQGVKSLDFKDWCKVAELMSKKEHLTDKGLEQIREIKKGMNRGRNGY